MPAGQKRTPDLILDGCEPLCGYWELNSGPLEVQPVLLTAKPSLQPPNLLSILTFISNLKPSFYVPQPYTFYTSFMSFFSEFGNKENCNYNYLGFNLILFMVSIAAIKHHDQRANWGGKGLLGSHFSITVHH